MPAEITNVEQFIEQARDRYDFGRLADAEDRKAAEYDNKFANADNENLDQWSKVAKRLRKNRPIIQWNRIPVSVQSVVNDGRQNKPSIRIAPGDGGKPETAEYIRGRIRQIEYETNADTAKDTARDQQITSGRGSIRVQTEYIPGTFDQRVLIERIENQFSVVWDPGAVKYDRSDADWCFVIDMISLDAHKRLYGEESVVNRMDFADAVKLAPEWIGVGKDNEMIQRAAYYLKEYTNRTLCLLGSTGLPAWKDDLGAQYDELKARKLIIREREEPCPQVWQYVINGAEVLGKPKQWIGSTIPIVPFWGREATVDGKRRTYSLVRNAVFPQQQLNLYVSTLAELLGQMPKTPYMVPVGGIPAAMEEIYEKLNLEARAFVYYEPYDSSNRPIPPPSRVTAEPPIQACVVGINQCIDAIKAAMGIFDAALGARSNENSGLAIQRRKIQSSITNYHFPDNEARSNKYLGEILVEILPLIDKKGSTRPIRTEDGKTHLVPVGIPHKDWKTGEEVCHDLMSGQYGVVVSQGPSYDSARQEQLERDTTLITANPELMFAIGPQMFRADDTAGSEERAEALERYINMKFPGLIPDKQQANGQVDPQKVQQQMQALQQDAQKAHAFAQSLHEQLQSKLPELQNALKLKEMELQFKREELAEKSRVELAKLGSVEDIARLEQEIEVIKQQAGMVADAQAQAADQQHQITLQQASQQHQADQQAQAQDHATDLQASAQDAAQQEPQESQETT